MHTIIGNDTSNNSFCGLISDIVFGYTTLTNYQSNETNFINISDEYGRLKNKIINKDNNKILSDSALVAITILIAESKLEEKEIIIDLIMNFLTM